MEPLFAFTPVEEIEQRIRRIQSEMAIEGIDALLVTSNTNIYYTTGRVINGYVYIPVNGQAVYFIRRPAGIEGDNVIYIHKPEQILEKIKGAGISSPRIMGYELGALDCMTFDRLAKAFSGVTAFNATPLLRRVRAVKSAYELEKLRESGVKHERVYRRIPHIYHEGMTDIELQIEIERVSRLEGCLGQFRIAGESMELFMSNILAGDNADVPTPYDFAMGGRGLDPSLPVGADGTVIKAGMSVMVDSNGNFTGYMTDMTRVYSLTELDDLARRAHQCSIDICHRLEKEGRPGIAASLLYEIAVDMVKERDLERYFMGHNQKAGFIGHGVGIEINELPVIAPRSRDILALNNVIAIEPKFVIPHVGAVGIENTYVVTDDGLKSLTNAPEEIVSLL
ncbi:Xaa-Pro peptidase family protein [uncultured Muribaculum sp.]|uniref:M24 family metallopeptidase n=1 Tax=uncultured Muribaculum sp. TaxID=1918613 RepID=UPI0025987555|nr:Xaa-Pro peptidase family protein [uncultured Muribaculum sp.]